MTPESNKLPRKILVTGGTGFVGAALVSRLENETGLSVRVAVRKPDDALGARWPRVECVVIEDLAPDTLWQSALQDVQVVVHLAARVHVMKETVTDALSEYRRVNVAGTLNLARQAAAAGVKRFVFLSSVKVNGESGKVAESDPPAPLDAYGVSKMEAEAGLREIGASTGMEVVMIRPPLVYGPGVKANFQALMRAVGKGMPLPLGAIHNHRSLVSLDNLVDFIMVCIGHPAAAHETFLVSDGEDLSTPDLIRRLARAQNRPARLIPVPGWLLMAGAAALGKRNAAQRLLGSLQVDISKARRLLGWSPPTPVDEGLSRAVRSGGSKIQSR